MSGDKSNFRRHILGVHKIKYADLGPHHPLTLPNPKGVPAHSLPKLSPPQVPTAPAAPQVPPASSASKAPPSSLPTAPYAPSPTLHSAPQGTPLQAAPMERLSPSPTLIPGTLQQGRARGVYSACVVVVMVVVVVVTGWRVVVNPDVVVSLQPRGGALTVAAAARRGPYPGGLTGRAPRPPAQNSSRGAEGGKKPLFCEWCSYKAFRRGDMNKHLRIHTGEKPFWCPACDFRSADSSALHRHVRARHHHHYYPQHHLPHQQPPPPPPPQQGPAHML
ncbi:Zinc finger Y-chromosomal protein [Portunus trituberculatus]|uniref:Zinc finger Y-chromosomal protein n=1 Tax=Portunus trituberculatus TaxID=210409 RepID=A0A5B7HVI1_PORTR|nr:Zinc finger Y-chromosomal protein [Portunus trituberculatus]